MIKKSERESYLMNMLRRTGCVTIADAEEMLGVSEATVRRLFIHLEQEGLAMRSHGTLRPAPSGSVYSFEASTRVYSREKQNIGRMAAMFVEDGDAIYLDCGTTVFQMTLALSHRISAGEFRNLNIVTNSIANVQALTPSSSCRVILVGGEYDSERRDFSGPLTERFIAPFHFNRCFLGCDGVTGYDGFSSKNVNISSLNSCVMERSDAVYVLCDSSKLDRCSMVAYAPLERVNAMVTDAEPGEALRTALQAAHVHVNLCGMEP